MAADKKEIKPALKKEKSKSAAQKKPRKGNLKKNFVAIGHFFKDVVSEMKKVTWPTKKEFISYSVAVMVFVLVFGLIIFAMDSVLQNVPQYIANLNK